ncbi:MAG: MFS transporter [Chloroflexi bacterium]|nr:MAG: MFS transporter [Chloroflexota bacterium]
MPASSNSVSPYIQRRITATLFGVQSLFSAGLFATFVITSIVAVRLGGHESWAGVPAMLLLGGRALIGYPVGWVMDRYGRRPGLILGYLLSATGAAWSASAVIQFSFWQFCLGAALMGMGRGISEQSRYVAAEIYPQPRRARVIGLLVWAGTIGAVGGPLLVEPSSSVTETLGVDAQAGPFLIAAVIALIAMLLIWLFLRPDPMLIGRQLAGEPTAKQDRSQARPAGEIFASPRLRLALAGMVIGQLVMTLIMVITPLHMSHQHHGAGAISWVLMAHTLGMFGLAIVTGRLIEQLGPLVILISGGMILAVASLMAPLANNGLVLALALFLLGLGWNFCFTAGSSLLSNAVAANERGRAQGLSESLVALAAGAGSLGAGPAFAYGDMVMVGAIGLACTLVFLAYTFWSVDDARQTGNATVYPD